MKHLNTMASAAAGVLTLTGLSASAQAQFFIPGNIVVSRVGTGAAPLNGSATAVFFDQFGAGTGAAGASLALPIAGSGTAHAVTNSGSAASNGFLKLSGDGNYLVYGGYDAAPGTAGIVAAASTAVNRVVARVDGSGGIDSSTALSDAYTGNNFRSVASADGTSFYTGGAGSASSAAVRYATLGATTSTPISSTAAGSLTNARVVSLQNNQIYTSSASTTYQGISTIGTGAPTTGPQPTALLPGFPTVTGPSSYDYFFSNASTLYVADDRATASGGGLQKWTLSGGTWSLGTTFKAGLTAGLRGLTGSVDGNGVVSLWATSADVVNATAGNKLVSITDTGAAPAFTTLATAAGNTYFEGLAFAPKGLAAATPAPSSLLVSLLGFPGLVILLRNRRKAAPCK